MFLSLLVEVDLNSIEQRLFSRCLSASYSHFNEVVYVIAQGSSPGQRQYMDLFPASQDISFIKSDIRNFQRLGKVVKVIFRVQSVFADYLPLPSLVVILRT